MFVFVGVVVGSDGGRRWIGHKMAVPQAHKPSSSWDRYHIGFAAIYYHLIDELSYHW